MAYTLFDMEDDANARAVTGLTLADAFARLMYLAGMDHRFERTPGGCTRLVLTAHSLAYENVLPALESDDQNLDRARETIMRAAIKRGWPGTYCVVTEKNSMTNRPMRLARMNLPLTAQQASRSSHVV